MMVNELFKDVKEWSHGRFCITYDPHDDWKFPRAHIGAFYRERGLDAGRLGILWSDINFKKLRILQAEEIARIEQMLWAYYHQKIQEQMENLLAGTPLGGLILGMSIEYKDPPEPNDQP